MPQVKRGRMGKEAEGDVRVRDGEVREKGE